MQDEHQEPDAQLHLELNSPTATNALSSFLRAVVKMRIDSATTKLSETSNTREKRRLLRRTFALDYLDSKQTRRQLQI